MTAVITAVAAATALVACSSDPEMSAFQNPRPWQKAEGDTAYEKLDYSVAIYDTNAGTAKDKRVQIASGTLGFTLQYNEQTAIGGNASLDMAYTVTYNDNAPQKEVGVTDSITSTTLFRTNSLETLSMQKTVSLGKREGEKDGENKSYTITADYSNGKATREMYGKTKKLNIPGGKYWDNEMMYYLARATGIKKNNTTYFKMTNLFDCFEAGEVSELTMMASAQQKFTQLEFDDPWIKDYVITKEQEDAEKEAEKEKEKSKAAVNADTEGDTEDEVYKVPCYCVAIVMDADDSGPAHYVYYSERPLEDGGIRHKRVPLKITYTQFKGSKATIHYEYTLSSISFVKQ